MGAELYYYNENRRWRFSLRAEALPAEAREAIERVCADIGRRPPTVEFVARRNGWANRTNVRLGNVGLNWLLVAHELAHVFAIGRGHGGHDDFHAAEVDSILRHFAALGYGGGAIEKDLRRRTREAAAKERRAAKIASVDPRAELIDRRYQQIARLDRKIKSLSTRKKKAMASLLALERAAQYRHICGTCGRVIYGNGGRSSHKRWHARQAADLTAKLKEPDGTRV